MGVLLMAVISLTSSVIKDFFVQRVTAVIIAVYFGYLILEAMYLTNIGAHNYDSWRGLITEGMF
ncbi:succinate dehydrogenase, hydrophobic membrane anchor protein, partial [Francisella tularensis subsp. holarctica]|nr:succinate dehydrogenase, hydrophobic membrane anchor protein [Francisella tularensis subsp. holarctica]